MGDPLHRRRASDHGWRLLLRENWYRDVWLVAITVLMAWALSALSNEADNRATAITRAGTVVVRQSCESQNLALKVQRDQAREGVPRLRALYKAGSLDRRLYRLALSSTRQRLRTLQPLDCQERVRRFVEEAQRK